MTQMCQNNDGVTGYFINDYWNTPKTGHDLLDLKEI